MICFRELPWVTSFRGGRRVFIYFVEAATVVAVSGKQRSVRLWVYTEKE
jgi:hypothetical protein